MDNILVYLAAAGFFIAVFPVHIFNYFFIITATKYASINAGLYKLTLFNANTVENKPNEMQINTEQKKIDGKIMNSNMHRILNQVS